MFPTNRQAIRDSLVVAPFWSDIDVRLEGEIHYKRFFRASEIEQEKTILNYISNYVAVKQGLPTNFTASTLLVVQWKNVPPFPHGSRVRLDNILDVFTDKVPMSKTYHKWALSPNDEYCNIVLFLEEQLPSYLSNRWRANLCCVHLQMWHA